MVNNEVTIVNQMKFRNLAFIDQIILIDCVTEESNVAYKIEWIELKKKCY